ncbi:MAG: thiamine pyrophosphate-dependent dehydrogenase E1 component subunit alpha [Rhodobacteraceae bacterium]|nr:thiamine pyrophosphate-dependent dehydrogenase E1 component subunit alpha [Paracoccaceae bacterium]
MTSNSRERLLGLFERMLLVRECELKLAELFSDGEVPGFIHLSVGQEAVAIGVMDALNDSDTIASNHRGHGHAIAKGVDLDSFFLEVMGKEEGICGGRGGSMHVADMSVGMLGANGIVGAGIPLAVGSALAHQVQQNNNIAVAFFGDGALAEGVLHESFNIASLWKLPILFVCENNGWSEFSPTSLQFVAEVRDLGKAFKIPFRQVDGNNITAVADASDEIVSDMRKNGGPRVLECMTKRVHGHYEGDQQKYRDADELASLGDYDPIMLCEGELRKMKAADKDITAIRNRIENRVSAAADVGRAGTLPSFDRLLSDVYTPVQEA